MRVLRYFLLALSGLLLLAAAFAGGFFFRERLGASARFPRLGEAYSILADEGLKPLPTAPALEYGMIKGMVQAYNDPYTVFVEPPQHVLESNQLSGKYGGIGVRLGRDPQGAWMLFPFPDGPALKAGVQEGDRLLAVDDLSVQNDTPQDTLEAKLRGPVDSVAKLTVSRADNPALTLSIKRAEIAIPSVTWHLAPGQPKVGVVEINLIAATTPDEVKHAFQDLQARGAGYFVLDLRNNPGGLLDAGVNTARLFLNDGEVIEQQYRGKDVESYKVLTRGALADLPLVALINKGSASAAEIIAGALQAHQRARLVGERSYGKDSIQLIFELKDGSSLHVTAAHWWVPGLKAPLGGNGLEPDIPVAPAAQPGPDPVLQAAIQALNVEGSR